MEKLKQNKLIRFIAAGSALLFFAGCADSSEAVQEEPEIRIIVTFGDSTSSPDVFDVQKPRDITNAINMNRNSLTNVVVYSGEVDNVSRPLVAEGGLYEVACDEDQFIDLYPLEDFMPPLEDTDQLQVTVDRRLCGLVDTNDAPVAYHS